MAGSMTCEVMSDFNNITVISERLETTKSQCNWTKLKQVTTVLTTLRVYLERRRGRVVRAARLLCRKSPYRVSSRLGCAMRRLENSLCQPSRKWVPFLNKGRIRQRKERDGLRLSSAVPKI